MAELIVKNRNFSGGRPLICVPVMETSHQAIVAEIKKMVELDMEVIEWRVDAFEQAQDLAQVASVLNEIKDIIKNTPLIFTFRSAEQGGLKNLSLKEKHALHMLAAESGVADFVDVEFFEEDDAAEEIAQLQEKGAHVIASHHNFALTPDQDLMESLMARMQRSGAHVVKLAVMPKTGKDLVALLGATVAFKSIFPDTPLITMSMGQLGCISRVSGEAFGSCLTFGALDKSSAPGQLPIEDLKTVLNILHQNLNP